MIMPKSFDSDWVVSANSLSNDLPFHSSGRLVQDSDFSKIELASLNDAAELESDSTSAVADTDQDRHQITVQSQIPYEIPIHDLLGASADICIPLDAQCLTLCRHDRPMAYGALVSYGRGGVFVLNQMAEPG